MTFYFFRNYKLLQYFSQIPSYTTYKRVTKKV
jgi:hypothetical protein